MKRTRKFTVLSILCMAVVSSLIAIIAITTPRDVKAGSNSFVYEEDFEYSTLEEAARSIGSEWNLETMQSWGLQSTIVSENGNRFLRLEWIEGRLLKNRRVFDSPTILSGKFKVNQAGAAGGFVFVRTTQTSYVAGSKTINEYENDGYKDGVYDYGVGATGVYLKFQGTKLQINVRTQEEVGAPYTNGLGRKYIEVDIPNGKNSLNQFVSVTIEDRNNTIKVYAEGQLMASVEYSNSVDGIYRNAVLKDAGGNVIYNITNARIADKEATFAISNRGATIDVDDLRIEAEKTPKIARDIALEAPAVQRYPGTAEYLDGNRQWQGIPGIEKASNGRLWTTWYSGSTTENEYNWLVLYTSDNDGASWAGPAVVIDPVYPVRAFDPMLWTVPDGRMWLFWSQSYYMFDGRAGVWAIYTDNPEDSNPTWSEPVRIANGVAMNKPIVLSDGTWMLPTSVWRHGNDWSMYGEIGSNVYVSTDKGKTWSFRGGVKGIQGSSSADENMVVELGDGSLMMYIRTTIGIEKSYSYDKGYTWSDAVNANITKTVSRFFLSKLDSGKLLLVYHNPPAKDGSRSYLTASISEDDGKTWKGNLIIDERNGVSYPDGFQTKDGKIYVIYDRNRGSDMEILMAVITEEDILAGRIVNPESRLKVLVNNNGKQPPKTPEDLKNTGITPTDGGQVAVLENNKTIFSNRSESRVFINLPKKFHGMYYVYSELEYSSARIDKDGDVYIFTKRNNGVVALHGHLTSLGFVQDKSVEPFRMFDQTTGEDTVVYHKYCNAGETISFGNWVVIAYKPADGVYVDREVIPQYGDITLSYTGIESGSWYALIPHNHEANRDRAIAWKYIQGNGIVRVIKDRQGGFVTGDLAAGKYDLVVMTGYTEVMRTTITVEYDEPTPLAFKWLFDKPEAVNYATAGNNVELVFDEITKSVRFVFIPDDGSKVSDPYVSFPVTEEGVLAEDYPVISFMIRKSAGTPDSGQIFFHTLSSGGYSQANSITFSYQPTADWQIVSIDMSQNANWKGEVVSIRLDPFGNCNEGDEFKIKYIAFFDSMEKTSIFKGFDKHIVKVEGAENGVVTGGGVYGEGASYNLYAYPFEGFAFGGWYDGATGEVISTNPSYQGVATGNMNITARFFSLEGKNGFVYETLGAQIRTAPPDGLRFVTQVNKSFIPENATNIVYGTLVTLERNLGDRDNTELVIGAEGFKYLDIKGEKLYRETEEYIWFTAVIIDIPEHEHDSNFVARSYITYTDGEGTHTIYDRPIVRSVNMVKSMVQGGN